MPPPQIWTIDSNGARTEIVALKLASASVTETSEGDALIRATVDYADASGDGVGDFADVRRFVIHARPDAGAPVQASGRAWTLDATSSAFRGSADGISRFFIRGRSSPLVGAASERLPEYIRETLLTPDAVAGLSAAHAAWDARIIASTASADEGARLSDAIRRELDEREPTLTDYRRALADFSIGFEIDEYTVNTDFPAGRPTLYALYSSRSSIAVSIAADDVIDYSLDLNPTDNALGDYANSPVLYQIAGDDEIRRSGRASGDAFDLGEFDSLAVALARRDAYLTLRSAEALPLSATVADFRPDLRTRSAVVIQGLNVPGINSFLIQEVSWRWNADGIGRTVIKCACIQAG